MPLQGVQSEFFGLGQERRFEFFGRQFEGRIHQRTVFKTRVASVHPRMAIHRIVEQLRFVLIPTVHRIEAADALLEPLGDESHDVDPKRRWGVPHRVFLCMVPIA